MGAPRAGAARRPERRGCNAARGCPLMGGGTAPPRSAPLPQPGDADEGLWQHRGLRAVVPPARVVRPGLALASVRAEHRECPPPAPPAPQSPGRSGPAGARPTPARALPTPRRRQVDLGRSRGEPRLKAERMVSVSPARALAPVQGRPGRCRGEHGTRGHPRAPVDRVGGGLGEGGQQGGPEAVGRGRHPQPEHGPAGRGVEQHRAEVRGGKGQGAVVLGWPTAAHLRAARASGGPGGGAVRRGLPKRSTRASRSWRTKAPSSACRRVRSWPGCRPQRRGPMVCSSTGSADMAASAGLGPRSRLSARS